MSGRGLMGLLVVGMLAVGCGARTPARFPRESIPVADPATTYATAPRPDGVVGGQSAADVERDVKSALRKRGAEAHADGALADTASWLLREMNEGRNVSPTILDAALRQFGFAGTGLGFVTFGTGSDEWQETLAGIPANLPVTRYGIRLSPSGRVTALLFGNVELSYEPIARHFEPNQAVTLKGEIGSRFKFGHVYLTKPNGTVEEKLLPGRAFDVTFNLTDPGKYQLEVMGDGSMGPQIVSNVPLYVGVPEPPLAGITGRMLDPEAAKARLLVLLNEARHRAGLQPLTLDEELGEIALDHSEDMMDHQFVSHVSPTTGTPEDRFKRSGILAAEFGENIASADTPEAAHEGLMNSPGHRAVILKPAFTHVGIGVVVEEPKIIATFNFARRVPAASVPSSTAQVEAHIAALRAKKGLAPAGVDPVYRAGAQAGAVALADGADDKELAEAIDSGLTREVDRLRSSRPAACSTSLELLELRQLDAITLLVQPGVRAIGVGTKMRTDKRGSRLSTVIMAAGAPCQ